MLVILRSVVNKSKKSVRNSRRASEGENSRKIVRWSSAEGGGMIFISE
jgi:hypothetical protein